MTLNKRTPQGPRVSVMLLAKVRIACDALARDLARHPAIHVEARGVDVSDFASTTATESTVLVYDGSSSSRLRELKRAMEQLQISRAVVYGLDEDATSLRRCALPSVRGFISHAVSWGEFTDAIVRVGAGGHYVTPSINDVFLSMLVMTPPRASTLTERETEVASLLGAGRTNLEICHALRMRPGTLKSHIRSIYSKLGTHRRTDIQGALSSTWSEPTVKDGAVVLR